MTATDIETGTSESRQWWASLLLAMGWLICLVPYVLAGTWQSIHLLQSPPEEAASSIESSDQILWWIVTAVVAGWAVLLARAAEWTAPQVRTRAIYAAGATYTLAIAVGVLVLVPWLDDLGWLRSYPADSLPIWIGVGEAVSAGVGEELVVLALGVAALAGVTQRRWWTVAALTLLVAARLSYHLYYGWGVLWLVPWAISAAALAWFIRSWWVIVVFAVVHTAYDIIAFCASDVRPYAVAMCLGSIAVLAWIGGGRRTAVQRDGPDSLAVPALPNDPTDTTPG